MYVLSRLQGDDDEDGPSVHAPHTAAVAHEVVQDGGELRSHLQRIVSKIDVFKHPGFMKPFGWCFCLDCRFLTDRKVCLESFKCQDRMKKVWPK